MKILVFFFLLMSFGNLFSQDVPAKYEAVWERIIEDYGDVSLKNELELLRKQNPNDPLIYWMSGIYCNPVTEKSDAIIFFTKAIEVDSTFPHAYFNLAQELEHETVKQIETKIKLLTKGLQLGCMEYGYIVRGQMYLLQKEYELALADSKAAFDSEDCDPLDAIVLLVQILDAQGNADAIYEILSEVDFSEGIFGTDFELFLAKKYVEMDDLETACYWFLSASEFFIETEQEIPNEIQQGLDACK